MNYQPLELLDDVLLIKDSNEEVSCPGEYLKSRNNLSEIQTEEAKKEARNNLDIRWGTLEGSPLENKLLEGTLKDVDKKVESNYEELLKRLQGKSDKSSAQSDPFLFKGTILNDPSKNEGGKDGAVLFNKWVNAMHGTTADLSGSFNGEVRINWSGSIVKINNFVNSYVNDFWVLVIEGGINYNKTKGFYLSNKYRKFSRHYTKENGWSIAVEFVGKDITDSLQQSILDNTDAIVKKTFCIGEYRSNVFTPTCKPSELISARDSETPSYFYVKNRANIIPLGEYESGIWNISPAHIGNLNNSIYVLFNYDYAANVRVVLTYDLDQNIFTKADVQLTTLVTVGNIQLTTGFSNNFPMSQKAVTDAILNTKNQIDTDINKLNNKIDTLGNVYTVIGSKASFNDLLTVTSAKVGHTYNIENGFYLNSKYYEAGTNVVCIKAFSSASDNKASCWDPLGGTFNASLYLEKEKAAIANKSDITSGIDRKEDITYTEKGKQYISGGALGSVLPFKVISKTTLDNGDIAWYRLAFNYPTGSSNSAQQLLLQYAVTSNQSEPSAWTTIDYVNNINLKDIGSIKQSVNNLTKNLQDNYFNKDEVQEKITKWLDEIANILEEDYYNKRQVNDKIKEAVDAIGPTGGGISGLLNLKDATAVRAAQDSITKNGETKTFIITDGEGNYPSPNVPTVYLDDAQALMDILYRGNGDALKFLLSTREAYYQYSVPFLGTHWYSQNISQYVKLPTFNLTTARVGDLVTIIRQELDAGEFYSKYIDFDIITIEDELFQAYKKSNNDTKNLTDGQFIKFLLLSGQIYSCPVNPEEDNSVLPIQLVSGDKVVLYTAQITPNTQHVYSGEFWSGNITAPGIYCYVTSGRPEGTTENFIGVVSKDGTKMLLSMKNPSNNYIYLNGGWRWIGVGKNAGGTGEVFNDYAGNFAHNDHGHAEGQKTYASWNSHAEGFTTQAGSDSTGNAHSEGNTTKAIGNNSHAEGLNTMASGHNSHAEGDSTQATIWNAHAEGYRTNARGNGSHAEGNSDGFDTHNEAIGMGSHVEGGGTQAVSDYAHAEGTCNVGIVEAIHEVGIGTNDVHKNAHTIMKDGKHFVYGVGGYDGTNHGQAKDLATIINSSGSIINKGTLNEPKIRELCESYETGIFSFIDGEKRLSCLLFKPYQPKGNYEFMCITHAEDGDLNIAVRGGDGSGHGGWQYITEANITKDSNKPISSKAVYNAIYSVLNTEV